MSKEIQRKVLEFIELFFTLSFITVFLTILYGEFYHYYHSLLIIILVALILAFGVLKYFQWFKDLSLRQLHLWKIFPGLLLLLFSGILVIMKLTIATDIPDTVPQEVFTLPYKSHFPANKFIIVYSEDKPTKVPVTFEEIKSIKRYWALRTERSISAQASGAINEQVVVVLDKSHRGPEVWGDTITGSGLGAVPVDPSVEVELPINNQQRYKYININVKADIIYPVNAGVSSFAKEGASLTKSITAYVISSEDLHWLRLYKLKRVNTIFCIIGSLIGIVYILWGVVMIRKECRF
jgi:hypothetical protein